MRGSCGLNCRHSSDKTIREPWKTCAVIHCQICACAKTIRRSLLRVCAMSRVGGALRAFTKHLTGCVKCGCAPADADKGRRPAPRAGGGISPERSIALRRARRVRNAGKAGLTHTLRRCALSSMAGNACRAFSYSARRLKGRPGSMAGETSPMRALHLCAENQRRSSVCVSYSKREKTRWRRRGRAAKPCNNGATLTSWGRRRHGKFLGTQGRVLHTGSNLCKLLDAQSEYLELLLWKGK